MSWLTRDPHEDRFRRELEALPDRVVGLSAPILVDRRLTLAIQARWTDTADGKLFDELFRDGGALGSPKTRAQVAFAIGLIDEPALKDLLTVLKIRNAFAHLLEADSFSEQRIAALAGNLALPDRYPAVGPGLGQPPADASPEDLRERLLRASAIVDAARPRQRFLRAAEILSTLLWLALNRPAED